VVRDVWMPADRDPALVIWHALNVLANVRADSAISTRVLEAEMLLLNLMLDLWKNAGLLEISGRRT